MVTAGGVTSTRMAVDSTTELVLGAAVGAMQATTEAGDAAAASVLTNTMEIRVTTME